MTSFCHLDSTGRFLGTLPISTPQSVTGILPLADGKTVIAGIGLKYADEFRGGLMRLNADGQLDRTFAPDLGDAQITRTRILPDGRIVVCGRLRQAIDLKCVIRLLPNGALDQAWQLPGFTGQPVRDFAMQSDGKMLVAGQFGSVNGHERHNIARLNTDGTLDPTFAVATQGSEGAPLLESSANAVYLAARFAALDSIPIAGIARFVEQPHHAQPEALIRIAAGRWSESGFNLWIRGSFSRSVDLQWSEDLREWSSVLPRLQYQSDAVYTDSNAGGTRRFYRLTLPDPGR